MEPIDRILACSARVFGLAPVRRRGARRPDPDEALDLDGFDVGALECCAAEGRDAERVMREAHDRPIR